MKIRCWGARGSLPVSGSEYIHYGGATPCIEVRSDDEQVIIIDAGTGIRKLGNKLLKEGINHYKLFLTHAHWDHIMGFPFFKPIYHKKTRIDFMGCASAQRSIRDIIAKTMTSPNFPIDFNDVSATFTFNDFCPDVVEVGSVRITHIPLNHPNKGMGYKFEENGHSFVFLTDNELAFEHPGGLKREDYLNFAKGADLLIHDAEYRPKEYKHTRGWGHSTFTDALDLAIEAKVHNYWIYHHNVERTDDDLESMVEESRHIIKQAGVDMHCEGANEHSEIEL